MVPTVAFLDDGNRIILEKLADLVPEEDKKRRKLLINLDKLAQAAMDAERSFTNKHGEVSSYAQPDFNAAIKAMESARGLLGLGGTDSTETKPAGQESAVVAAIRGEGLRVAK